MTRKCCVPGCTSKYRGRYNFPVDENRRQEWIKRIADSLTGKDLKSYYVCKIHFHENVKNSDGRLSKLALPTLHLPYYHASVEDYFFKISQESPRGYTIPENLKKSMTRVQESPSQKQETPIKNLSPLRVTKFSSPQRTYSRKRLFSEEERAENSMEMRGSVPELDYQMTSSSAAPTESFSNECRDTWTKLRNAYTNAMKRRKSKSGQGAKNSMKWRYEEQMKFLAHTIEKRRSKGHSEPIEQDTSEEEETIQEIKPLYVTIPLSLPEENVFPSDPSLSPSTSSPCYFRNISGTGIHRKMETPTNEIATIMGENSYTTEQTSTSHNEMDLFFLSLSKTAQRLSPEEQVRVKMEVSNLIFQAELRELQCKTQTQEN